MNKSFAGILGYAFIGIGIIGFIVIVAAFDWESWNDVKDLSYTYPEQHAILKQELTSVMTTGFLALIGNLAVGAILLSLSKIIFLLGAINGSIRATNNND